MIAAVLTESFVNTIRSNSTAATGMNATLRLHTNAGARASKDL
jgi:hypothetical protein